MRLFAAPRARWKASMGGGMECRCVSGWWLTVNCDAAGDGAWLGGVVHERCFRFRVGGNIVVGFACVAGAQRGMLGVVSGTSVRAGRLLRRGRLGYVWILRRACN
eukprot:11684396-Alexandrium_andersonii.AAC.1